MKYKTVLLMSLGTIPTLCLARTVVYGREHTVLDRLSAATVSRDEKSATALELLERVALDRTRGITAEAEKQVGVEPGEFLQKSYRDSSIRAYAFGKIGETGLPEAIDFLSKLTQADIGPDTTQQIWPAAQIALQNALLNRIADPQLKIEFLERMLTQSPDGRGAKMSWAVDQLCDRGATTSLAIIRQSVRSRLSGQDDEDEIRFCEARMDVLSRDPDRAKALGSLLRLENSTDDARLIRWAIYQLAAVHSERADAELRRIAAEMGRSPWPRPESSPDQQRWYKFRQEIDACLEQSRARQ